MVIWLHVKKEMNLCVRKIVVQHNNSIFYLKYIILSKIYMSSVHSYTFDSLSRIGDDVCGVSERESKNENFGSYSVQSYFR